MKRIVQTLVTMMILILLSIRSSYGSLSDEHSMSSLRGSHSNQPPIQMAMSIFNIKNSKYIENNEEGITQFKIKQFVEAVKSFTKVVELRPEYADGYNNRGLSYYQLKKYDDAIQDFNKAISLNPEFAEAYNNRAMSFKKKGMLGKAERDRKKAIELDGSLSDVVF
jgi:tetratricopeptide (TPR) repeat protein